MDKKNVGYLCGGIVVGGALGVLATILFLKKKFVKELDRRVGEMEEYYQKTDEYDKSKRRVSKDDLNDEDSNKTNTGREKGVLSSKQRADICKHTVCNEEAPTDYTKAFRGDGVTREEGLDSRNGELKKASDEELLAENEYPEEEIDEDEEAEKEMFESNQKERTREPRLISYQKLEELDASYDNKTLFFYMYDDTVTDEDDNVIDEYHYLLGDCIEKYGFIDNDEQMILVQNFAHRTIYEVQKVWKSFDY